MISSLKIIRDFVRFLLNRVIFLRDEINIM